MGIAKAFFWGLLISFLGTLPLSTLNVSAMQISSQEGIARAMYFSLGTLVTEMIYVRISLLGVSRLLKRQKLFKSMEWITVGLLLIFAAGSFYSASQQHQAENVLLNNHINRFFLGMFMSSITFMHFPFWFGWSSILFTKKILRADRHYYNFFVIAIGIGTFLANCIFIYGGIFISKLLHRNENMVNLLLGWVFVLTAIIQLVKIFWGKNPAQESSLTLKDAT
jgi:threonine/homoserine/homoserine lactone efflux protein